MTHGLSYVLVPVALAAVATVLMLGLWNTMQGGPPQRSQRLMRRGGGEALVHEPDRERCDATCEIDREEPSLGSGGAFSTR